ncbi:unnamed protein product [Albugo candida]|uniref:Uncharacterized protein n=1 Tax=Albugo candida TaxID=65357 RepID=A0A024GB68_9STRA|nr:unnamed protein product [Albugo candida]|eukprot:CCI43582.1 unnamed protein product [Albugo candida]
MANWTALNSDLIDVNVLEQKETKEAQESRHKELYEKALRLQKEQPMRAKEIYYKLLSECQLQDHLAYLCNKNLASLAFENNQYPISLKLYASALKYDTTDVLIWYHMGQCAMENGDLWLARHLLEQGVHQDHTFWPILQQLCKVLYLVGDTFVYNHIASYLLSYDTTNPFLRLMNQKLIEKSRWTSLSQDVAILEPYEATQRPTSNHSGRLKLAQDDLTHYEAIWQTRKRRRTTPSQKSQNTLTATFQTYTLTHLSWKSLGLALLEALNDLLNLKEEEMWTSYSIRQETIQISWDIAATPEKRITADSEAENNVQFKTADCPLPEIVLRPAESIDTNQVDSLLLPERRKSRRHQDRLREEHQAAIKTAREKDIAFQLGKFIGVDNLFVEETCTKTKENNCFAYWKQYTDSLTITHKNEQFRLCLRDETEIQCRCFTVEKCDTENKIPIPTLTNSEQRNEINSKHVIEFLNRIGRNLSTKRAEVNILQAIFEYLIACGDFAHTKLESDFDATPSFRDICIWNYSLLNICLHGKPSDPKPTYRISVEFATNTDDCHAFSLPFHAKVFSLELEIDRYLETSKSLSRKRIRPNHLIAQTQALVVEYCLKGKDSNTLVRLFWLLGSLYESVESWEESTHYFSQCLTTLAEKECILRLPHRSLNPVISIKTLGEKLQAMAFTTQYAHAKVCFSNRQYAHVIECLQRYFFPSNAQPQWDNILGSDGRQPLRLFWTCVRRSSDTETQQSMLSTLLFQLIRFIFNALQNERSMEEFGRAFDAIEWLLQIASKSKCAYKQTDERNILETCCVKMIESLAILLLSNPSKAFKRICSILSKAQTTESMELVRKLAYQTLCRVRKETFALDSFVSSVSPPQGTELIASYDRHKEELMLQVLEVFNEITIVLMERGIPPSNPPSNIFLLECCRLLKEEERKSASHGEKTASLFLQAAIAFVLLQYINLCAQQFASAIHFIDSIAFLHEKLAGYTQCCSPNTAQFSQPHTRSFASVSLQLLEKMPWNFESAVPSGSRMDPHDKLLEAVMAQCFRCLYDVQLLPNLDDHHTKRELTELDLNDVFRVSQFAFRILLTYPPKSTSQKRENTKLLNAVRDALMANSPPLDDHTLVSICKIAKASTLCLERSGREAVWTYLELDGFGALVSPTDALWKTAVHTVDAIRSEAVDEKQSKSVWFLSHLWYLMGENDTIPRRTRGSATDLRDLHTLESRMKCRLSYFLTDVLHFHPERRASWVEISRLARDLYLAVMDTMLIFFGRHTTLNVLQALWQRAVTEKDVISIANLHEKVLQFDISQAFDRWNRIQSETLQSRDHAFSLEKHIGRCCLLLAELAWRSCTLAAALGDPMRSVKSLLDVEPRHTTLEMTIECLEEAGLLLYGLVQDTALDAPLVCENVPHRKHERLPMQLVRQALWMMEFALQMNNLRSMHLRQSRNDISIDAFAYEMTFRLEYIAGKLAKKLWKWQCSSNVTQTQRILLYWVHADGARVLGKLEQHGYGLLHAFYAIQSFRLQLLLSYPNDLKQLHVVLTHSYASEASEYQVVKSIRQPESTDLEDLTLETIARQPLELYSAEMIGKIRAFAFLNILDALEYVCTQDRYFHSAHYTMAKAYHYALLFSGFLVMKCPGRMDTNTSAKNALSEKDLRYFIRTLENRSRRHSEAIREPVASQVQLLGLSNALDCMASLFDKKRSQVVAVWFTESIAPIKKFDGLNQRQAKYDGYRLRYWAFYLHLLQQHDAYGRLNELTMWASACKEQHDVVGFMLESVLHARADVLEKRFERESCDFDRTKALSKVYGFYVDVSLSLHRIERTSKMRLKERSEKLLIRHTQFVCPSTDKMTSHEWKEIVCIARQKCEALWPERTGKSKHVKPRVKAQDGGY